MGVCIDTCHAHASGFDLTSKNAFSKLLDDFDKVIGIQFLKGMHLNDSMGIWPPSRATSQMSTPSTRIVTRRLERAPSVSKPSDRS